jgi:CRISPR type III-B/RAMP module RAMP protein Cmr6
MPSELILPKSTVDAIRKVPTIQRHPGLQLDKYSLVGDQTDQRKALEEVCKASRDPALLDDLRRRRDEVVKHLPALPVFRCKTTGPLTLHLSRASALENAGICLHPLYGFVYLPGTGLKGMAHAFACEVWLPAQPRTQRQDDWEKICRVFGWAPSSWLRELVQRLRNVTLPRESHAGSVVFHDALPAKWPELQLDIVNNHHRSYYERGQPPGDWEDPNIVSFLTIGPGHTFEFVLSDRRANEPRSLLDEAKEWLLGALCHLGAGAKTSAGYGYFEPTDQKLPVPSSLRTSVPTAAQNTTVQGYEVIAKLRLDTPAFLGGADKHAADRLRLPSIKGLLRYWWRTWHGHLTAAQLRQEEAKVFGAIEEGCGLSILPIQRLKELKILKYETDMTLSGASLGYLGYGPLQGNITKVKALRADQILHFRMSHRSQQALEEVLKSFWLLGALGGVGSRSRRGWGSAMLNLDLTSVNLPGLASCATRDEYEISLLQGLEHLVPPTQRNSAVTLEWTAWGTDADFVVNKKPFDRWEDALNALGEKLQAYRRYDKRRNSSAPPGPDYKNTKALLSPSSAAGTPPVPTTLPERAGFGLPYAQAYSSLRGARATFTPFWQDENGKEIKGRRASPIFCKIVHLANNKFHWQVAFLPARFLPAGAMVRAERKHPAVALPDISFNPPGPFGVATTAPQTLLRDFWDWLKTT